MRSALLVHDEVLRDAIEAHGGYLFSHTGDGAVAAFASPMSAVNAAIDAQRELQLPVRMGLATGEAELRDGDYFGAVLNRAARVMAAALEGRVRLLVFDNCEHVLDAAADLIDGILAHSACQLALEEELSEPRSLSLGHRGSLTVEIRWCVQHGHAPIHPAESDRDLDSVIACAAVPSVARKFNTT